MPPRGDTGRTQGYSNSRDHAGRSSKGGGGLSDKDITSGAGWGNNSSPTGPTIERPYGMGQQRPDPFAPSGPNQRWGTTPGTAPALQQQQDDYNSAWDNRQKPGFGGWLRNRLVNVVPGFRQEDPNWNDAATYMGGTYHDSWSPWGAVAELAGVASPLPGTSFLTGMAGNALADELGAERYVFGSGWGPAVAPPSSSTSPQAAAKEAALRGTPALAGRPTDSGGFGAVANAPGGAPFGPQPTQNAALSQNNSPAMFTPKLANHSLPQGYQRMFPSSLSEQDKALLYAQALGGMG
jgi:hypothetical protein